MFDFLVFVYWLFGYCELIDGLRPEMAHYFYPYTTRASDKS